MKITPKNAGFQIENDNGVPLIAELRLTAGVDGREVTAANWRSCGADRFEAEKDGIRFLVSAVSHDGGLFLKSEFVNETGSPVEVDFLRCSRSAGRDSLAVPGPQLRVYREGWTMASACGTVGWGETDFHCNPSYLPFAVSAAERFEPPQRNRFTSEYVTLLLPEQGDSLLAGFVTTADRVCRFEIELGETTLACFDAVSCGDRARLLPGETFRAEELLLLAGRDAWALLQKYAEIWGERMHRRHRESAPTGWCSWYYYFAKVTEADVLENLAYLKTHSAEWPLEYLQLDDGYEAALGDWLTTNEKFPHGLAYLARQIRAAGIKPGLWLAPFMVEERSSLLIEHPDYVVHNSCGDIAWTTEWRGNRVAVLDGTNPETQAYLRNLFRTIAEIGFEYVKLDFMMYACAVKDGRYHDPGATRVQALRRGLAAIREGFGEDRFILGCTTVLGATVGLVDSERIATDITPYWRPDKREDFAEAPNVPNVCRNVINRNYMHKTLWINDPDVHIVRSDNNRLSPEEVRLWSSALWLTGGTLMLSDRFETLIPERAAISKLLLRQTDAFYDVRPLDFRDRAVPSVWFGRFAETGAPVYGFFNFGEEPRHFAVRHEGAESIFQEHWSGQLLPTVSGRLEAYVPPRSCQLFFGQRS